MIYYDSHRWRSLLQLKGSVLPKAMVWAMPSAIVAFVLKYCEQQQYVDLDRLNVLTQGDIYSGFTYVLGFSLVFRTSQSYLRYWTAATSVHEMSSEWSDSCASLIAFATVSRAPHREIQRFNHTVVRLFSLLHATALSEIASISEELPLVDVQGLSKDELLALTSSHAQGRKVQIVLCWIKTYIIQMADKGLLNVPAPILTRVFQELGAGLVNFHKSQQIVIWPFPFPYTQLNLLLIQVYTIITPLVVTTWETWAWMCFVFTFISVTCMMGLDLIASELENPFGDDPNDLPVLELQGDMNKFLTFQLAPVTHRPPELLPSANMDYKQLIRQCTNGFQNTSAMTSRLEMDKRLSRSGSVVSVSATSAGRTIKETMKRGDKYRAQMRWVGRQASEEEITSLQRWLRCLPSRGELMGGEEALWSTTPAPFSLQRLTKRTCCFCMTKTSGSAGSSPSHFGGVGGQAKRVEHPAAMYPDSERTVGSAESESHHVPSGRTSVRTSIPVDLDIEPKAQERLDRDPTVSPPYGQCASVQSSEPVHAEAAAEAVSKPVDWSGFVTALHQELRVHMDQQLEMQRKELTAIEGMLNRLEYKRPSDHSPRDYYCSEGDSEPEKCDYLPAPMPRPSLDCSGIAHPPLAARPQLLFEDDAAAVEETPRTTPQRQGGIRLPIQRKESRSAGL